MNDANSPAGTSLRLIFEPLTPDHSDELTGLLDPRVNAYFIANDMPTNAEDLRARFERMAAGPSYRYPDETWLNFAVRRMHDGRARSECVRIWHESLSSPNICENCIALGAFASEMNRETRDHGEMLAEKIPAPRIGAAADMQGVSIFLASRAGDYAVGILPITHKSSLA